MALQKKVLTDSGVEITQAYARIDTISGSKESVDITLNYYVSQLAVSEGKSYLKQELYTFIPSVEDESDNFIKQGYEHLKALSEFEGAVDV
ncbi:hypothetical protein WMW72_10610 [Paenibacillus filicis]|uniref:Uncharacterized protein n=1 Tax=Paenibacillus filicis TaxID=669464 RepID=A0ABU9DHW2_9BACL